MPNCSEMLYLSPHMDFSHPNGCYNIFLNFRKNCDLLLSYRVAIFILPCCFYWTVCVDSRICIRFTFVLCVLPVVSCTKEAFHRELRRLLQPGEVYGKSITYCLVYSKLGRQTCQMDSITINTIANSQLLMFMGQTIIYAV